MATDNIKITVNKHLALVSDYRHENNHLTRLYRFFRGNNYYGSAPYAQTDRQNAANVARGSTSTKGVA